ncbi:MAG: hypothetical protein ACTSQG_03260 [Promethearchaeota archaeon]
MSEKLELESLDKVIQEFAPEVADIYSIREDESEEQQIKTGRLHENRILGIILKFFLEGKKKVTTGEVENEYKKYFKDIARSTISTYLNMLKKESTLYKERDGRIVYYIFFEKPPKDIKPFWFTRIFCIVPAYFVRALYFSELYINANNIIDKYMERGDKEILTKNFKFLIGLTILYIMRNRGAKCILCQFSKRETYNDLKESLEMAIKDRSDVLPEELLDFLINRFAEIPIFGGIKIDKEIVQKEIIEKILKFADDYKKDLEFQIMVSSRRTDLRLRQKQRKEVENSD